jgi:hypothetical protein
VPPVWKWGGTVKVIIVLNLTIMKLSEHQAPAHTASRHRSSEVEVLEERNMRYAVVVLAAAVSLVGFRNEGEIVFAQVLPNPYRIVDGWAQLPNGRPMGAVGKAAIDRDGRHLWAVIRCEALADPKRFGDECRDSKIDSVYKFGPDGKVVTSFGGGMFIWPHGLAMDPDGGVWVTDAVAESDAEGRPARATGRQVQCGRQSAAAARHAWHARNRSGPLQFPERRCRGTER